MIGNHVATRDGGEMRRVHWIYSHEVVSYDFARPDILHEPECLSEVTGKKFQVIRTQQPVAVCDVIRLLSVSRNLRLPL